MWTQIDSEIFGEFTPFKSCSGEDIHQSVFLIQHKEQMFYVHQCDEDIEYVSYFVRKISPGELELLKENKIELKTFLKEAPQLYVVRDFGNKKIEAYKVDAEDFSDAHFPSEGTYLYHEQDQSQLPE